MRYASEEISGVYIPSHSRTKHVAPPFTEDAGHVMHRIDARFRLCCILFALKQFVHELLDG